MWEKGININEIREIRTRTNIFFGIGAIQKIGEIAASLKAQGIDHVLVVTGRGSYKSCGAWDMVTKELQTHNLGWGLYDKVTPNPTADQVDEAAEMGRESKAGAVIAIGGGSPIDAGKSAAILLKYPDKTARDLYEFTFAPEAAVPIVAINITHGTGTEVNRFAVVTIPEKDYKPAIAYDCIYPTWSIDDPALTVGLPPNQTRYVSIDAVNHVIEAATTIAASPYSVMLGKETIRLIAKYLPVVIEDPTNLEARYFLMYAAMLAGVSFDNGLLHYTHALAHPLRAVRPELPHGLSLAILLPAVVENIYGEAPEILADLLSGPVPHLKGIADEGYKAAVGLEKWLFSFDVTSKLQDEGFSEADIPRLVELTFSTPSLSGLLRLAPTRATKEVVEQIYRESLTPMS
ncbi:MAG: iron-containing alcohol dehydrogenase [Lentisphaerae bacterium]|nr:iron-containing alcohol dehydrogenase [Lentisphaerota bacterium]